jgi:endonuclease G, mitochondrial
MLLSVDQIQKSEERFNALGPAPVREDKDALSDDASIKLASPEATDGNLIGAAENLEKRKQMLEVVSPEPVDFALERAIGKNDSVYSNFVELIEVTKRKVGRIAIKNGSRNIGFATGTMVSENLLLTNWHVFKTKEDVADSEIQFFYELGLTGNPTRSICFKLRPDVFYYSNQELDYCFVAVNNVDVEQKKNLHELVGYVFLDPGLGKLGNEEEEAMNIIHHPDGDYMQLSIRENIFTKITPTTIWYKSDTAPGSSGALVFNDQWQVVALHHMGVAKKNAQGEYVDKDNNVIPVLDGKIDAARVVWEANEGIRISVVLKDLFARFPDQPMVNGLKRNPGVNDNTNEEHPTETTKTTGNNTKTTVMEPNQLTDNVTISFPASLLAKNGTVNFNINQGAPGAGAGTAVLKSTSGNEEMLAEEIKKLEQDLDLSRCKGYQSKFLGTKFDIALPQPKKSILKFIAKVNGTDSVILKYYNYSTIFHSVRMMPIISGVNVEGDENKRLDNSQRKDNWLRDNRINYDIQLDDAYYKGSGFDRGHMSRREDANWGATAEEAKRNADLTCMYTNACPQVAKINQSSRSGLWGILEKVVLEQGAEVENGKTARISVFNGPIFKEDDPVYKGIQVPMDFFKVVLWLTDNGNLKATAFKLSQEGIVDDIDFEQLDLDQNTRFKEYQCSIKSLETATKIDFSEIVKFDTFDAKDGSEEVALTSVVDVASHVREHKSR